MCFDRSELLAQLGELSIAARVAQRISALLKINVLFEQWSNKTRLSVRCNRFALLGPRLTGLPFAG